MYATRYSFHAGGATVECGVWDPDRWRDQSDDLPPGGFAHGMTADVHAYVKNGNGDVSVTVNQGSMGVTVAEAVERAKAYLAAIYYARQIEILLDAGLSFTQIGAEFEARYPNGEPGSALPDAEASLYL